jgi:hypothetical protein
VVVLGKKLCGGGTVNGGVENMFQIDYVSFISCFGAPRPGMGNLEGAGLY